MGLASGSVWWQTRGRGVVPAPRGAGAVAGGGNTRAVEGAAERGGGTAS